MNWGEEPIFSKKSFLLGNTASLVEDQTFRMGGKLSCEGWVGESDDTSNPDISSFLPLEGQCLVWETFIAFSFPGISSDIGSLLKDKWQCRRWYSLTFAM